MMPDPLSKVTLFAGISLDGLSALARQGVHHTFPAGRELMRQGDVSETMYIILSGRVRVERSHPALAMPLVLEEMGPGEVVGEMGVVDRMPRSATVTAMEDTETLELGALALMETLAQYPEVASALLHILSQRLRSTDELIEEMLRRRQSGATP